MSGIFVCVHLIIYRKYIVFDVLVVGWGYEDIKNPNKQLRAKLVIAYRDLILMLNVILYFTVLHRQGAEELAALSLEGASSF